MLDLEDVEVQVDQDQKVEEETYGYRSRRRELALLRNPVQGNLGTGEPGQKGHQASRMPGWCERAQGHCSPNFQVD